LSRQINIKLLEFPTPCHKK